jgi:hypothetical protein
LNLSFRPFLALVVSLAVVPAQAFSPRITTRGETEPFTIPSPQTVTLSQVGRLANIRIIDRSSGSALPIYEHQGEYWVVGSSGSNYAISMQRRQGHGRTLAVTSVDGINVISGQTAAYLQTGYVLSGFGAYEINGWRKNLQEVAAFTFAAPNDSYASRTGRAANIGVIGVALFSEQQERLLMPRRELDKAEASRSGAEPLNESPPPPAAAAAPSGASSESRQRAEGKPSAESKQSADSTQRADAMKRAEPQQGADSSARAPSPLAPGLGTGHGQREASITHNVAFKRASNSPDEVIQIRYDSLENMVRRGVLAYAQPLTANPPTALAFPRSTGFVTDLPRQ